MKETESCRQKRVKIASARCSVVLIKIDPLLLARFWSSLIHDFISWQLKLNPCVIFPLPNFRKLVPIPRPELIFQQFMWINQRMWHILRPYFFGDSEEKKPEKKRNNSIQQKLEATHAVSAKSSEQGGSGPWARAVDPRETGHMLANTKILKPATGGTTPILLA